MRLIRFFLLAVLLAPMILNSVCAQTISSPGNICTLTFALTPDGEPTYKLKLHKLSVIKTSRLGIVLKEQESFIKGFEIVRIDTTQKDETWESVWGERKQIRNHYRELAVTLSQTAANGRLLIIRFRLFDDGLGFRYEFPKQNQLSYFTIADELTEFQMTADHTAFWIPGDYDTNEYFYSTSLLSKVNAYRGKTSTEIGTRTIFARNGVQTPLMMKSADGLYINIHEAALVNYPAMQLEADSLTYKLKAHLVPDVMGNKAYLQTPAQTPWRTIIAGTKAADILSSNIILNLNEPSHIADISWIKPQKYVGIWWEMHVGKSSWNYADTGNIKLADFDYSKAKPNGKHGATTSRTKRYIDFASQHGFDGVLIEGWNTGWEDWYGNMKEEVFDFVTPYPDFNVEELESYAKAKGVKLIMHHETSSSVTNYERRMDEAYRFMKQHCYDAVKTGYVGRIIPRGEFHDGQWMVNHYIRVAEKTAANKIMLDAHEPVRPTGLHRTYPNWLACEAARGNEFNAWSIGNPPEHETILPFTRLLGGPMDYTPGIFQIKMNYYDPNKKEQIHTTLIKQLALYVTMYSPLQMAADLPENYERFMDAFQFIKDVAVDWDETKILDAEPGDYLTIARKAKGKNEWFLGAITDENSRSSDIKLNFLPEKQQFIATVYEDGTDAHWEKNPMAYKISKAIVNSETKLKLRLAPGGGTAISFKPATKDELKTLRKY
jgi:glucan 1,4-alpha-glucosidase